MNKKQCFKCKQYKNIDLFYKHTQMLDGHLNKCISCTKKDVSKRYFDPQKRLEIREYERIRNQKPDRRKRAIELQRIRRLTYKGKYRAHCAVNNAIRDKRIIRKPCEVCGELKVQAHHTDYRKYYDVKWLCFKHHRQAHKQLLNI